MGENRLPYLHDFRLGCLRHNKPDGIAAERLRERVSENILGRRIPGRNSKIEIPLDHRQRRLTDMQGKPALGFP